MRSKRYSGLPSWAMILLVLVACGLVALIYVKSGGVDYVYTPKYDVYEYDVYATREDALEVCAEPRALAGPVNEPPRGWKCP